MNEIFQYCFDKIKEKTDKCELNLSQNQKYELNLESGEISLLRTTFNNSLHITVIKDAKKGSIVINKIDHESIDAAIANVLDICESSEPDAAFDVAPFAENRGFIIGDERPELDKMYDLLNNYVKSVNELYPTIKLMDTAVSFDLHKKEYANSNGVLFSERHGMYSFNSMFAAKENGKSSSFNGNGFSVEKLERELLSYGSLNSVLQQTTKQIETKSTGSQFAGDVILTPDCMGSFIYGFVQTYLTDMPLITKTSLLRGKLGEEIVSPLFSLEANPLNPEFADRYNITNDGFAAENMEIIESGVLKSYLLSLYGANKTGLPKAKNSGGCFYVKPGDTPLEEMIKNTKRGVLVARISGGNPNNNGDLSMVLKNSFYIENGEIKFPIKETMITSNLLEAFKNIKEISRETVNFGDNIFPYVKIGNVLISGK